MGAKQQVRTNQEDISTATLQVSQPKDTKFWICEKKSFYVSEPM